MRIIEIKALENGAHRNQESNFDIIPEGWAVIPEEMEIPDTFPFVNITTENETVTSMTAGVMPEPEEEELISPMEQLRADVDYIAVMTGVTL